jgi:hypothetical protein
MVVFCWNSPDRPQSGSLPQDAQLAEGEEIDFIYSRLNHLNAETLAER